MDLINREDVISIATSSCLDLDSYDDTDEFCDEVKELPSAFEGMTNRDVLKALYPIDENKGARLIKVYLDHEPIESFALTTTQKWLDSPYKGGE